MKYQVYIGLLLFALALAACDNPLAEQPQDFVQPERFYTSADNAIAALNGVYAGLDGLYGSGGIPAIVELPTEVVTTLDPVGGNNALINNWRWTASLTAFASVYSNAYSTINRANAVIERVPGIENMDEDLRARIIGETRFLRAFNYFNLVRLFGAVPLIKSETASPSGLEKPRTPEADIYAFIIEDLETAIEALPSVSAYTSADAGRASKGAAKTLLAKVYLTRGSLSAANGITGERQIAQPSDYRNAADLLQEVIDGGEYGLVENFADLFDPAKENNEEVIFAIQYISTSPPFNTLPEQVAPANSTLSNPAFSGYTAELPFYIDFPDADARKEATFVTEYVDAGSGATVTYNIDDVEADGYLPITPAFYKYATAARGGISESDYILLRYADVLLMKAEALNEVNGGPTTGAYAAINQVRERAEMPLLSGLNYNEFREVLLTERRRELVMEAHGWFDGQRFFDLFKQRVEANADMEFEDIESGGGEGGSGAVPQADIDVMDPQGRLFPIPQTARDKNSELTQNPGY